MQSTAVVPFLEEILHELNSAEAPSVCPNTTPVKQSDHVFGEIPSELRSLYQLLVDADREYKIAASKASGNPLKETSDGQNYFLIMKRGRAKVDVLTIIFQQSIHRALPETEHAGWAVREHWQIVRLGPGGYRRSYV